MKRREQNQALRDLATLDRSIAILRETVPETLRRGTFDSGERRDPKGTTVRPELRGTLEHSDPTGEEAIREEIADRVGLAIAAIAKHVTQAMNLSKWVLECVPTTTDEAVQREIPNCMGCDEPVFGRVKSGYCQECYDRRRYLKVADRAEFRRVRMAELAVLKDGQG